MYNCKNCKDTGRITLLFSSVDCDCIKKHRANSPNLKHHTRESGLLNGWFSEERSLNNGWAVYLDTNDNEVNIVEVSIKPTPMSIWKDLEFVGVVEKRVKTVDRFGNNI